MQIRNLKKRRKREGKREKGIAERKEEEEEAREREEKTRRIVETKQGERKRESSRLEYRAIFLYLPKIDRLHYTTGND